MNIEEHKENLKKYIEEDFAFREPIKNMSDFDKYCYNHCQDIKEVLNELDKKDKVIDMMAKYTRAGDIEEDICKDIEECMPENLQCENCIKEYFYKKAEEEK